MSDFIPLGEAVPLISEMVKTRIRDDYDAVIAITGGEGTGKSTLGIQLGMAMDPNFSLERSVIYFSENMVEQIMESPRFSYNMVDEAARALYSRTWYEKRQILINKYLRICRKENKILTLIIPNFWDLDSGVRNRRVLIWIWVLERNSGTGIGKAAMFINDLNQFYPDPWGLKEGQKIFGRIRGMAYLTNKVMKYKYISQIPSFVCFFEFPKLDDGTFGKYRVLAEKANEEIESIDIETDKFKAALANISYRLNMEWKLPAVDIADMCDNIISQVTISKYIREKKEENEMTIKDIRKKYNIN